MSRMGFQVLSAQAGVLILAVCSMLVLAGCDGTPAPTPLPRSSIQTGQQTSTSGPDQAPGITDPGAKADESQLTEAAHEWVTANALGPYRDISAEIVSRDAQYARVRTRAAMRTTEGGEYEEYKVTLVFEKTSADGNWQLSNSPSWINPAEQATRAKQRASEADLVDLLKIQFADAPDAHEGWAIGTYRETASMGGILFHIQDGVWEPVLSEESGRTYTDLFVVSKDEAWVVTQRNPTSTYDTDSELLRYVSGDWDIVRLSSDELSGAGIYMTQSGKEGWLISRDDSFRYTRDNAGEAEADQADDGAEAGQATESRNVAADAGGSDGPGADPGRWATVDRFVNDEYDFFYNYNPTRVYLTSSTEGWAVTGRRLLHLEEGVWSRVELDVQNELEAEDQTLKSLADVEILPSGEGYIVGSAGPINIASEYGIVLRYNPAARKWSRMDIPETGPIQAVDVISGAENEAWAVGDGDLLHLKDGVWAIVRNPTKWQLTDVKILPDSSGWAVGDRRTILRMEAGSTTWVIYKGTP